MSVPAAHTFRERAEVAAVASPLPVAATRRLKRRLLGMIAEIGLLDRVRDSVWRARRLAVLCYHGISIDDEHCWDPALYMSLETFESRLEQLAREGYVVLSLDEAIRRLAASDLPPRSVVLTFDDGYHDFAARALPALEARALPASVYLTTYYSEFNRPVFGIFCSYLLYRSRRRSVDLAGLLPGARLRALGTRAEREALRFEIVRHVEERSFSAAEKDHLAQCLAERLDVDHADIVRRRILHLMTPDEVSMAAARGIQIELHTHRHRVPRDRHLFAREIEENRSRILAMTGRSPRHFCYPSGEYHESFLPWLSELGVATATTCEPGLAGADAPPLLLPRIVDTESTSLVEFASLVAGVGEWVSRRRRA